MTTTSLATKLTPKEHTGESVQIENEGNYFTVSTLGEGAEVTFHIDELEPFIRELRRTVTGKDAK